MRAAVLILGAAVALSACTRGNGAATPDEQPTTTSFEAPTTVGEPSVVPATGPEGSADETTTVPPTTFPPSTLPPITTVPVVEVPESGVPGIDSADAFCAAWSRFGGSWQVIQVAANFAPDPSVVPTMEVAAAPVIGGAYDTMFANWPGELAGEEAVVADGFFGPLDRRAEAALDALVAAGATSADVAAIGDAWVAALQERNLDDPVLLPTLTDEQWALVDTAAATFTAQRVDFVDDPSMRITAETPRTDAYLATACPDQGALTGGEIDAA